MNYPIAALGRWTNGLSRHVGRGGAAAIAALLLLPLPSLAHHPFGEQVPVTFLQGFLSGLGHPIIGPDHLAFVVAVGLLAAVSDWGLAIPAGFVLAAMGGAGLHLAGVTLPLTELAIAASVLGAGLLLARKNLPRPALVLGLAALAGLFHGFAYGEAIFGAEPMPLGAYLAGFTAVQLGLATAAFWVGQTLQQRANGGGLQRAGLVICGLGAAFLATAALP